MMTEDLLEIPPFLRREPGPIRTERKQKRVWIMPSKAKAKPKPKRKKGPNVGEGDRYILRSLGWTDKVLKAMPKQDIEMILNKPRYMQSADEVAYLKRGKDQ